MGLFSGVVAGAGFLLILFVAAICLACLYSRRNRKDPELKQERSSPGAADFFKSTVNRPTGWASRGGRAISLAPSTTNPLWLSRQGSTQGKTGRGTTSPPYTGQVGERLVSPAQHSPMSPKQVTRGGQVSDAWNSWHSWQTNSALTDPQQANYVADAWGDLYANSLNTPSSSVYHSSPLYSTSRALKSSKGVLKPAAPDSFDASAGFWGK